ncbi:MAG: 3-hydroxylacyl-ACP dehydratase [Methylovulum sp.]|uniref:ApeP family dehydratase n=1 Tax=Methylovulum sp. TaxID=1916980 RepID=UPI00262F443E|nr:3-hydroxylacyl-ACP dehydratase [Methylovulum sp.]MDD2724174.1 3-hydroxylacyl-ACP dehydratase [Methylovulum sp.]MDD5123206.1 3-hydroxylacyl-ACP dehydratase [Methylovulum sp.]
MNGYALTDLLPHAGGMMLLDKIIRFDDQSMVAEVIVNGNGLFGDEQSVPALVGIEYMAQAISAHSGMMDKIAGRQSYLGFLLGTRLYTSNVASFLTGAVLTVHVKIVLQEQGLGVFDCKITAPGVLVEAKLNVYQPKSEHNRVLTE